VEEGDQGAVVGGEVELEDEVRKQDEEHAEHLYPDGEYYVFAFVKQRVDEEDGKGIVDDETDAAVDDETPEVALGPQHTCHILALKQEHQDQSGYRNYSPENP